VRTISAEDLRPPRTMYAPRTLALFLLSLPTGDIEIAVDDSSFQSKVLLLLPFMMLSTAS
jgi:hypothetical protein